MLTLKTLRDDPQHVIEKLAVKNFDARAIVEKVLELDTNRRALQTESDAIVAKQNQLTKQIGGLMKDGKKAEAEEVKKEVANSRPSLPNFSPRPMRTTRNLRLSWFFFRICLATSLSLEREPRTIRL